MKILVCIKQVPETESPIHVDDNAGWIQTDAIADFKMNRLDEFAVEEAVLIKEAFSDTVIDTITVGPDRAEEVIKRAIGMGADQGVHVLLGFEGYQSPSDVAAYIAQYAQDKNYTLILTGAMSEDGMQGQIGVMIAAHLDLPCATAVIHQRISADHRSVYVEREIEGGNRDTLEMQLPAVLTIQSGINRPRYPSLSNLLRANRQELATIRAGNLTPPVSPERVVRVAYPEKSRSGTVLTGTQQQKATQLLNLLREKALL